MRSLYTSLRVLYGAYVEIRLAGTRYPLLGSGKSCTSCQWITHYDSFPTPLTFEASATSLFGWRMKESRNL
jgi:hypothetical protein